MILGYADTTFLATIPFGPQIPTNPIVFDVPVQNSGGHYDNTTGIYTAPIDGTYEFIVHILSLNDYQNRAHLVVDGTDVRI